MRKALNDPDLFLPILEGDTWKSWRILLIAAMGEPLTDEERVIFERLTGRPQEPKEQVDEFWAVIGRRGGKTRASAVLAAYLAALCDYSDVLAPGERASLLILSATVWQSKKAHQYLDGIFANVPVLNELLSKDPTSDAISLKNRVDIECRPASFRTVRGGTCIAVLCDEVAFWRSDESSNPDTEILNALRPCLATTGGPLIAISSPYAKRGELYQAFKRDYGPDGDAGIIVAKAASRTMNPSLSQKVIDRAFERDPVSALSEYGNENVEFRSDIEAFISREVVEAITVNGRYEIPKLPGTSYCAFVDTSGGSGDDMVLAIAHQEGDMAILDLLRVAHPPFNPDDVTREFAATMRQYGCTTVKGDRYGGEWPVERFNSHGVEYLISDKTKNDIYIQALPLLMGKRVELLDHAKLQSQLIALERKTTRGGRESIDHPSNGHDDVANAACGALTMASGWNGYDFDLDMYVRAYGDKAIIARWEKGER